MYKQLADFMLSTSGIKSYEHGAAIFARSEAADHNASNENLEELDRSNQVVSVLLKLLTSEQNSKFEHRHECFGRGMNLAEWYDEQEGKN